MSGIRKEKEALMLMFMTTPLELVTGALTLIGIGVCIGYVARDIQGQNAETP
jgi:hypothetical protein